MLNKLPLSQQLKIKDIDKYEELSDKLSNLKIKQLRCPVPEGIKRYQEQIDKVTEELNNLNKGD